MGSGLRTNSSPKLTLVVLESHQWVPLAVGLSTSSFGEKEQEDVTLPPNLMEHPPLAVFVNGNPRKNRLQRGESRSVHGSVETEHTSYLMRYVTLCCFVGLESHVVHISEEILKVKNKLPLTFLSPRYSESDKRDWRARLDAGRDNRQKNQLNLQFNKTHISPQGGVISLIFNKAVIECYKHPSQYINTILVPKYGQIPVDFKSLAAQGIVHV
ncbi:hypothetical protein Tco_0099158, partial [Tanacetum coccineum]